MALTAVITASGGF